MYMIGCAVRIRPLHLRRNICRRWLARSPSVLPPRQPVEQLHCTRSKVSVPATLATVTLPRHRGCEIRIGGVWLCESNWPAAKLSVAKGHMASEAPAEVPQLDRNQFTTVLHLKALRLQASQCQDYVKALSGCACIPRSLVLARQRWIGHSLAFQYGLKSFDVLFC